MSGDEIPPVISLNPIIRSTHAQKTPRIHTQVLTLTNCSGQNYEGFMTTVADEAKPN